MSFIQFEVWGVIDEHEELIDCVGTLKEAEAIAEEEQQFHDEVWILEDTDEDLREVRRYKGL
jgi:hypothetical protein